MRQYVYVSTAQDFDRAGLDSLVQVARQNNELNGITGFLLFNGRNFLQLIEGPESSLIALMHKLAGDPRHSGIVRMVDRAIDERDCPDWSMNRLALADRVALRREQLEQALPPGLSAEVRQVVLNFAALN